ncbi:ANK1 [Branchiostoma lanceolatum]|uniref:ANK1 protein n=1 Tax=Branchiostoma lanceolatum TaxID=7740 RepID=A0A8K0EI84_BRALA|nr:ANK1 [Branchiostoma lanceolatum]
MEGDTDRVKRLLAEGVNPNAAGRLSQWTPLHIAAENGHLETVSALMTAGADVNARFELQWTPLHKAAENGHLETASALLTAGADVNARDIRQRTPLHIAAYNGHLETASALLTAGADVNARGNKQWTPLHFAAQDGHRETASALLTAGADVNALAELQRTPLHVGAQNGHHETVSALLTAGADVNARDNKQITPLHRAAQNGHHETVSVLLTAGADVNARDNLQLTPLNLAAGNGYPETVSALLAAGTDVNARDEETNTSLNLTGKNDRHETASILLTVGADIHLAAGDNREHTPHNEASQNGHVELPLQLLQGRAGTGVRNESYAVAEDMAVHSDHAINDDDSHNGDEEEDSTDKAYRQQKEYDPILVRFYEDRGMTVAKKNCPLMQEAARKSGKTLAQVKNFIGNYRKSKGGSKRRPPADDVVVKKMRITGYHEYYSQQLPRKRGNQGFSLAGANKEIGESWKSLTEEEKDPYNKAAEERRERVTKVQTWPEVSRKLKQLQKLSEELEDLGVETLGVSLYKGEVRSFGSQMGKDLVADEEVGGFIGNQLKSAELKRKAVQCLNRNKRQKNTESATESPSVAGTSMDSTNSTRQKRAKVKGARANQRQHSRPTVTSLSLSSTQG